MTRLVCVMFKLVALSSPSGLFEKISFRDGLNIILGKYTKDGRDINGIGKTSIVRLVDYCLLADGPKKVFSSTNFAFLKKETVALEFLLRGETWIIERRFDGMSLAYLSVNGGAYIEYSDKDLRLMIGSRMVSSSEYEGVYSPSWFRNIMNFFVQDDKSFMKRDAGAIESFIPGKSNKPELLTYNLLLLGLDNRNISKFDDQSKELRGMQSDKRRIEQQITEDTGSSVDSLKAEIESIERKVKQFEESLSTFKFEGAYEGLEEGINRLSREISSQTKEYVAAKEKLNETNEGLQVNFDVDTDRLGRLYAEINEQFGEFVKKSFDEVVDFRRSITVNRSLFLQRRLQKLNSQLDAIKAKIVELGNERAKLYKRLEEQKALDSIKGAYLSLLEERTELLEKSSYIRQLDVVEEKIIDKQKEITNVVSEMVKSKLDLQEHLDSIKDIFHELVERSVDISEGDVQPYINVDVRAKTNSPLAIKVEVPRSGSLGKSRFEVVAYDLTVFLRSCSLERELPRFLIHDGVFHGIAHKTRVNLLNYLDGKLKEVSGAQYVITLNEDEIGMPDLEGELVSNLNFPIESRAIAILGDSPSQMLFGNAFG